MPLLALKTLQNRSNAPFYIGMDTMAQITPRQTLNTLSIKRLREARLECREAAHWAEITESKTERRGAEWRTK